MAELDWLIARPVAHRGLHDAAQGVIENTPTAFAAAVSANYGMECDVQLAGDGEAMVHHDEQLGRLTEGSGRLDAMPAAELKRVPFRATADRMLTLGELCDLVAGRSTLMVEIKSRFDGDRRLAARVAKVLSGYAGPIAVMSFDPAQICAVRETEPKLIRGMVAERRYEHADWNRLSAGTKRALAYFGHALRTHPQFVAYAVRDLPGAIPFFTRRVLGLPLLTWTVRTAAERLRASEFADQMIFEGFRP